MQKHFWVLKWHQTPDTACLRRFYWTDFNIPNRSVSSLCERGGSISSDINQDSSVTRAFKRMCQNQSKRLTDILKTESIKLRSFSSPELHGFFLIASRVALVTEINLNFFDWPLKNECATRYNIFPFYAYRFSSG